MKELIEVQKVKIAEREVFPIGLGTWNMGDDKEKYTQELNALKAGLDAGIQVIDTAEMYSNGNSESLVGHAIKPFEREKLYLVSKSTKSFSRIFLLMFSYLLSLLMILFKTRYVIRNIITFTIVRTKLL